MVDDIARKKGVRRSILEVVDYGREDESESVDWMSCYDVMSRLAF